MPVVVSQNEIQVAFGKVVGNVYYYNNVKMNGNHEKILKGKVKSKLFILSLWKLLTI